VNCHTPIVDYSSVIDLTGEMYCCRNCLAASASGGGHNASVPDLPMCDHCECPLVEPDSLVERHGERFCCYNCAVAERRLSRVAA
jgi:hypothetical protein